MKKIFAVVGSSFEGLLAAHAVTLSGSAVVLFDVESPINRLPRGTFIFNEPIPETDDDNGSPCLTKVSFYGTLESYKEKAFPEVRNLELVVPESEMKVWNVKTTMQNLQLMYRDEIINRIPAYSYENLQEICSAHAWDGVFVAAPKPYFCKGGDEFTPGCVFNSSTVFWTNELLTDMREYTHLLDGTEDRSWFRQVALFDESFTEFSTEHPYIPLHTEERPISNNCKCNSDVHWVGRDGSWSNPNTLRESSFAQTLKVVLV